jgi:hypothetical protein
MMVNAGRTVAFIGNDTTHCGAIQPQWQFNGVSLFTNAAPPFAV